MTETEIVDLTQIVGEIEIPCDYDRLFHCGPAAAEWAMFGRCGCGYASERLTCGHCKDLTLQIEEGLSCPAGCGEVFIPARKAFARVEML